MTDPCPGRCNARCRKAARDFEESVATHEAATARWEDAWLAAEGDPEAEAALGPRPVPPTEPDITWTPGAPVWCERDRAAIRRALVDLDDLAALLESWSDGHRGASSGERTSSRRTTAGSPSPIADTLDEMYQMLARVESDWRDAHEHLPPRPHRAGPEARPRTIAWLLGQLDAILAHPGSVRFGKGVLAWQRRLQEAAKSDPVVRRRPAVPCPRCDRRALRTRDDGYTQCGKCGRLLDEAEYDELAEAAEVRLAVEQRQEAS